ncbi:MAG: hypothetical protein IPK72_08935 [Candidatus Eisenbacteria bacterium]|nr:hypothetical protein [Candidatus Eisenbacteria bacterium]
MSMASLDSARAAKTKALKLFSRKRHVGGIGITRLGAKYAVQVNLEEPQTPRQSFPTEIDGVPVVIRVTGVIRKQAPRKKTSRKDPPASARSGAKNAE